MVDQKNKKMNIGWLLYICQVISQLQGVGERGGGRFFGWFLVTRYCTKYLYLHHVQEALQIPNDFWFKSCSLEMRKCQQLKIQSFSCYFSHTKNEECSDHKKIGTLTQKFNHHESWRNSVVKTMIRGSLHFQAFPEAHQFTPHVQCTGIKRVSF